MWDCTEERGAQGLMSFRALQCQEYWLKRWVRGLKGRGERVRCLIVIREMEVVTGDLD